MSPHSRLRSLGVAALLVVLAADVEARPLASGSGSAFRRQTIRDTHRLLLLPPPPGPLVDELYDYYLAVSERAATGEISPRWAAYLYVNYTRDAQRDRPQGVPRRTRREVEAVLEEDMRFFSIRRRPEAQPSVFGAWVWQGSPMQ